MFKYIIICMLLVSMTISCASKKNAPNNIAVSSHIIKETIHDTVYVVKADTSKFYGTLKVDSNGKINLSNINAVESGKYVKVPVVKIKNNKLEVDCYAEAQELFKQWKEQHITDTKVDTKIITKSVPRQLTFFQELQIWTGRVCFFIVVIGLIGNYFKPLNFIRNGKLF